MAGILEVLRREHWKNESRSQKQLGSIYLPLTANRRDGRDALEEMVMGVMKQAVRSAVVLATMALPIAAQSRSGTYYNGMRRGYSGGYNDQYDHRRYDNRDEYNRTHGGIGPGKGALIGGAGGAALGALFGGGLKGALIAGGAGAGVGAIAGKVHQDNKRDDWRDYRRGR